MIKNWKLFTESKKYTMVDHSEIPYNQFIEIDQKSQQSVIKFFVDRNFIFRNSSLPYIDVSDDKLKIQAEWESNYKGSYLYNNTIVIIMIDDEWYYVRHHKLYIDGASMDKIVKCDQLDGLMEYLSDTVPVI